MYRTDVIIPMGLASMVVQGLFFAWAYPRLFDTSSDNWLSGAVQFWGRFGLVFSGAASRRQEPNDQRAHVSVAGNRLHGDPVRRCRAVACLGVSRGVTGSADVGSPAPVVAQIGVKHMVAPPAVDLQIALRNTFILEAAFFQHPA